MGTSRSHTPYDIHMFKILEHEAFYGQLESLPLLTYRKLQLADLEEVSDFM